jgi:hypothetical protein
MHCETPTQHATKQGGFIAFCRRCEAASAAAHAKRLEAARGAAVAAKTEAKQGLKETLIKKLQDRPVSIKSLLYIL